MKATSARSVKRFGRAFLALLISGALAFAKKDPRWLFLAPVVQGVAKYLRDKFGVKYMPV